LKVIEFSDVGNVRESAINRLYRCIEILGISAGTRPRCAGRSLTEELLKD
jgi:hypothetical protein